MTQHIFGAIVTPYGTAANNRGENEGNMTTLQKLVWKGEVHTTVSAEAIRFALRAMLAQFETTNRAWDEDARSNKWQDADFKAWKKADTDVFIDDDLLGFMSAQAAKEEGGVGSTEARRAVLEVSRAVSLTPWAGDTVFNAASPGATPSAAKKGSNPVPYAAEIHATRYQFGFALTPERLRKPERAALALQCLASLADVAGNHGRFLYDFSPESIVLRVTDDPAPRLLYCFEERAGGVAIPVLVAKVKAGDIAAGELIIGGAIAASGEASELEGLGATVLPGVRKAADAAISRIKA